MTARVWGCGLEWAGSFFEHDVETLIPS